MNQILLNQYICNFDLNNVFRFTIYEIWSVYLAKLVKVIIFEKYIVYAYSLIT